MAQAQFAVPDPDEALPFFSVTQAKHFRSLVAKEWVKSGRTVTMFPDHMTRDDGAVLGLWNLAADCHRHPQRLWPRIVADQVRSLSFDPFEDPFQGMSTASVLRKTYVRLQAAASLPDPGWYPYAREVAPGILELIALHHRRAVTFFRDCDVERFGGLELLRARGLGNLRILPMERRELIETPEGGSFRVLLGKSSFTASRLLTLDRLVSQLYTDPSVPLGVLAAMPSRNEVAVHIIRDASAVPTLVNLATFARLRIADSPGPLSADIYWVNGDRFEQVTSTDEHGMLKLTGGEEFQAMMEGLLRPASTSNGHRPGFGLEHG